MKQKVLSFQDEQVRHGAYARSDRGIQTIEVRQVVGSVGRWADFDRRFRYRRASYQAPHDSAARLRRLRQLYAVGRVPPVELYQIGEDYFVLDGHHRVALAIEFGQEYVDAHVVEYRPDPSDPTNVVQRERSAFVRETGLHAVHVTEPGRYPKLLSRIQSYRHELVVNALPDEMTTRPLIWPIATMPPAEPPNIREAARRWFESEYSLVVDVLRAEYVLKRYPERGLGDLYGYVCDHRWYLSERQGWDVGLDVALVDFVHQVAHSMQRDHFLDPVVSLGSDLLDTLPTPPVPLVDRVTGSTLTSLVVGLLAIPFAFLRGLRPRHYRYPYSISRQHARASSELSNDLPGPLP